MTDIIPSRGYVLIDPIEEDSMTKGGIAVPDGVKEQSQRGKVLAIGAPEIIDGKEYKAEYKVGDIVLFGKWQGMELKEYTPGKYKEYKLLKYEQIAAREIKK